MSEFLPRGIAVGSKILISRELNFDKPVVGEVTELKTASVAGRATVPGGFMDFAFLWWRQSSKADEHAAAIEEFQDYGFFDLCDEEKEHVLMRDKVNEMHDTVAALKQRTAVAEQHRTDAEEQRLAILNRIQDQVGVLVNEFATLTGRLNALEKATKPSVRGNGRRRKAPGRSLTEIAAATE